MPPIDNLDGLARRLRRRPVAVIAHGGDEDGAASVALWWADARGRPQAGWVFPAALAARDPRVARRLLWATRGRVVVGWRGVAGETVAALLRCAGEVLRAEEPEVIEIPAGTFGDVSIVGGTAARGVGRADGVPVGRAAVGVDGVSDARLPMGGGAPAGRRVHCPVVRDVMVICELIAGSTEPALAAG